MGINNINRSHRGGVYLLSELSTCPSVLLLLIPSQYSVLLLFPPALSVCGVSRSVALHR